MENKKIIIVMVVIIVILLAAIGMLLSGQMMKDESKLKITDKKINAGDSFKIALTDVSGNPISNQTVHVKITDNDGTVSERQVTTDSKGNAKVKMNEKGKFAVECIFDGNDKFSPSSLESNVNVKKAATKLIDEEQAAGAVHSSKYDSDGSIYPEYGPDVDSQGITREYAIANDMHYIEMEIDGETVGGYTAYDPAAGCYHT